MVYFDPFLEDVSIRTLTAPERADRLTRPLSLSVLPDAGAQLDLGYDPTHIELNEDVSS